MAAIRSLSNFSQSFQTLVLGVKSLPSASFRCSIIRHSSKKHWNPKWKWHRTQKVVKVELMDFHPKEKVEDLSEEEMRSRMKEKGYVPPRYWAERPIFINSTGGIFEPYVPPEGDGKISFITKAGAKQKYNLLEKKGKSMMAIRKIRSYDEDFEPEEFVVHAQEIYINAHNALMTKEPEKLVDFVTERGIPEMMDNVKNKTLRWSFIKSLEPPRIVHARYTDVITNTNIFGQLTVRFHSQQTLAVYDRFGRLLHGSEILAKDVLEYIVFEKHLSNIYGKWRLHDKVIPDWMPPPEPGKLTFQKPPPAPVETATSEVVAAPTGNESSAVPPPAASSATPIPAS